MYRWAGPLPSATGEVSEWPKEHAWKVCMRKRIEGSNPSLSAIGVWNKRVLAGFVWGAAPLFPAGRHVEIARIPNTGGVTVAGLIPELLIGIGPVNGDA